MKKILFILLLAIACVGCERRVHVDQKAENAMYGWNYLSGDYVSDHTRYRNVVIDNHTYIVFTHKSGHSGGISVVHSENCPCKQKKK